MSTAPPPAARAAPSIGLRRLAASLEGLFAAAAAASGRLPPRPPPPLPEPLGRAFARAGCAPETAAVPERAILSALELSFAAPVTEAAVEAWEAGHDIAIPLAALRPPPTGLLHRLGRRLGGMFARRRPEAEAATAQRLVRLRVGGSKSARVTFEDLPPTT